MDVGQTSGIGDAPWWGLGGGGLFGGNGRFADFSSNAERTNAATGQVIAQNDFNHQLLGVETDALTRQIATNAQDSKFLAVGDRINSLAMQSANCCCDLKQEIAENRAELTAIIKDTTIESLRADLTQCRINDSNSAQTAMLLAAINNQSNS